MENDLVQGVCQVTLAGEVILQLLFVKDCSPGKRHCGGSFPPNTLQDGGSCLSNALSFR